MIKENRKLLDSIPTAHGAPDSLTILYDYNKDDGRIEPGLYLICCALNRRRYYASR